MTKKQKCKVCNYNFQIDKSKVYQVEDIQAPTSLFKSKVYIDVMDCPNCGCQHYLWKRLPKILINGNKNDN